jgi:hypothetical protein
MFRSTGIARSCRGEPAARFAARGYMKTAAPRAKFCVAKNYIAKNYIAKNYIAKNYIAKNYIAKF